MANTIQDKLAYLEETKGLIKQAIAAKGVSVSEGDTFRSYADKIETIQTGGGGTVNLPDGTKFSRSTFTTVSDSIIPYLEAQTDLSSIFMECIRLTTVPLFNTNRATNMQSMFDNCLSLTTVPLFDTSNVTDMNGMFYNCQSITTVPLFDTSNVTDMNSMFYECSSLTTVPLFVTSNVTDMNSMFYDCPELTTVPPFNTSNVTSMDFMFYNCGSITTVPQFNTINVTSMNSMFDSCSYLTTVPLFDTSNVTDMNGMFNYCSELTTLGGFTGLKLDLDLSSSPLLTVDSVMNIINEAADMTSEPVTLTLHQDVFNKLTEEQITTASAKGWNIASY